MQVEEVSVSTIRNRIMTEKNEKYRLAFMYALITGCELTEVCGLYSSRGEDAYEVYYKIDGVFQPAVLFKIKSARRDGSIRSCVLPSNPIYEPWVEPILKWFKKCGNGYVFNFSQTGNLESSQRYTEIEAKKIFKDLTIIKKGYRREKGRKIDTRPAPFTFSALREIRKQQLKHYYNFDEVALALFGGWREYSSDPMINIQVRKIFDSKKDFNLENSQRESEKFFKKLLIKYDEYEREQITTQKDNKIAVKLINQTKETRDLLKKVNSAFEWNIGYPFFVRDNDDFLFSLLDNCDNEELFKNKISGLSSLFEVKKEPYIKLIINPPKNINDIGTIELLEIWFKENNIVYDSSIFNIWKRIRKIRSFYPTHAKSEDISYKEHLSYFGITDPIIDYELLWDNIINAFCNSLQYLLIAMRRIRA